MTQLKSFLLKSTVLLLVSISVLAETIVIDGELLNDFRRTPVLGGGFSLTTEDYKSLCFDNVETSIPSYDYEYTFHSSEEETKRDSKSSDEYGYKDGFSVYFASAESETNVQVSHKSTFKRHRVNLFVVIRLNSYYASLNEAKSILSTQAKELIRSEDIIGFFDACGTYYIRTINRQSRIYAWLTLESKEKVDIKSFKFHLENSIKVSSLGSTSLKSKTESESQNFFKGKQLSIKIIGRGLGKEHVVNLSPSSLEDFKKVISNASKSMSGIHTGRITSIEIIPWMDNLSFQHELKPFIVKQKSALKKEPGEEEIDSDQLKSASFKRKWIVAENGELISMLKNKYRALQAYQFATMNCQAKLERIVTRRENIAKQANQSIDWQRIGFKNHFGYAPLGAKKLYHELLRLTGHNETQFALKKGLNQQAAQSAAEDCFNNPDSCTLYQQWEAISEKADNCLATLYPEFTIQIYRDIPSCKGLVAKLTALMPDVLFYYCAPVENGLIPNSGEKK